MDDGVIEWSRRTQGMVDALQRIRGMGVSEVVRAYPVAHWRDGSLMRGKSRETWNIANCRTNANTSSPCANHNVYKSSNRTLQKSGD